ncbi:MAG: aminotransferase [Phycisphaeraceae bacterium]|nr:MAG: aminotransferase [Phycisphaeraceae bacterium]
MDHARLISARARAIDASGIRRILELGHSLPDPINLSIGQPDFAVPEPIRAAGARAIEEGRNGYTLTQGDPDLIAAINGWLTKDLGWSCGTADGPGSFVTSGTSGALTLAFMALLDPGSECIIPDPYFVSYPHLATMCGATAVACDTYPDFRMTAERVEPLINDKTRFVLLNAPSNPCGVVLSTPECHDLLDLCRSKGVLLISDEIYDEFCYPEALTDAAAGDASLARPPSPARLAGADDAVLLIRGFGKSYGVTGWRLGYAAGPREVIGQMSKLQQYTFVCAPAPLQRGVIACFDVDMSGPVDEYRRRRDLVVERLSAVTKVAAPGGAFYAFFEVPPKMGITATQFVERAIEKSVLVIPGGVFSERDTHVRLSFAAPMTTLERGLDALVDLMS